MGNKNSSNQIDLSKDRNENLMAILTQVTSRWVPTVLIQIIYEYTLSFWDSSMPTLNQTLEGHGEDSVWAMSALPNNQLAVGHCDGTINIWNLDNFQFIKKMLCHTHSVITLLSIPDYYLTKSNQKPKHKLASTSYDCTLKIWDLETSECLKIVERKTAAQCLVALDNQHIALGNENNISIYCLQTHTEKQVLTGHQSTVIVLCTLNNGFLLSGSTDGDIHMWNTPLITSSSSSCSTSYSLSPEKKSSVSLPNLFLLRTFKTKNSVSSGTVYALLALENDNFAAGYSDCSIKIWSYKYKWKNYVTTCKLDWQPEPSTFIRSLGLLPDGNIVASYTSGCIRIWKPNNGALFKTINEISSINYLFVLDDGQLVTGLQSGRVLIWGSPETEKDKLKLKPKQKQFRERLSFAPTTDLETEEVD